MSIKVLVVDDHPVIHDGLKSILREDGIEIVGNAMDGTQVIEVFEKTRPNVILMDVRMPGQDGLATLEKLRESQSDARVIIYSSYDNPTYVARAAALGAKDYLLKSTAPDVLIATIRSVVNDEPVNPDSLLNRVKKTMRRRRESGDESIPLTNREMQVLRHVAMGLSNREIGKSLGISIETVKEHVQNILRKLDVNDRTQAAVWAVKRNLV